MGHTFRAMRQILCLACIGMPDCEVCRGRNTLTNPSANEDCLSTHPLEVPPTLSECLLQDALSDMFPLG